MQATGAQPIPIRRALSLVSAALLIWQASAAPVAALAQEPVLSLPDLIAEALSDNPEILAAQARRDAAKAKIAQAWGLKDPWVSYDVMGSEVQTRTGPQEQRFGISQALPFPAKLPLRRRAARLAAMQAEHEVLHAEQHVRSQLVAAYAELMAAQQGLAVLRQEQQVLEQLAAAIQAGFATGRRSAADAAKIEAELARLAERVLHLEQRRTAAEERLAVLLGRGYASAWPMLAVPPTPQLAFTPDELVELAKAHRHRLVIAKLMEQERQVRYRLAQMGYLPDLEVGFMYTAIGSGTTTRADDGEDAWMVPIRVSLPFFWEPQTRGRIREARAEKAAAVRDTEQAANMARAEVIDRLTRYRTASDRVRVYEATWLPQAEQAFASTHAAYQAGQGTIVDALDSERMVLEARLGYWQSVADTATAYAALEQAVGIPFETLQEE